MQTKQAFAKSQGVSVPVVDSWIYRHGLPVLQIGRRIYINEQDFLDWLTCHKKTVNEKPEMSPHMAIPKRCRKNGIVDKIKKIY